MTRAKKNRETFESPGSLSEVNSWVRDYRRISFFGSTTHIVNRPMNAPAAMIASIHLLRELLSTIYFTQRCYILFSIVLTLCYIWRLILGLQNKSISHQIEQQSTLLSNKKKPGDPGASGYSYTNCGVSGSGAHLAPGHWV